MSVAAPEVSNRIWTVPNVLSVIRLGLIPVFLWQLLAGNLLIALLILIGASLTDFLDGWIARRWRQITRLGQLLDPAADRLYLLACLIGFCLLEVLPWWVMFALLARDLLLLVLGVVLANHGYGPLPVHHLGKAATFCLFYAMPIIMLGLAVPALQPFTHPIGYAALAWGGFLYWWAGVIYLLETHRVIRIPADDELRPSATLDS